MYASLDIGITLNLFYYFVLPAIFTLWFSMINVYLESTHTNRNIHKTHKANSCLNHRVLCNIFIYSLCITIGIRYAQIAICWRASHSRSWFISFGIYNNMYPTLVDMEKNNYITKNLHFTRRVLDWSRSVYVCFNNIGHHHRTDAATINNMFFMF